MKPKIPAYWRELRPNEVIETDDQVWQWNCGPWAYVGGSLIGERYQRACATGTTHWKIIRRKGR